MKMIHCDGNISCPTTYDFMNEVRYIRRAGIIPFLTDMEGNTFVLIGLNKDETPVWADLGGRAEKGETTIETALREYGEESRWVLPVDMSRTHHILITHRDNPYKPDQALFMVEVDMNPYTLNIDNAFQQTVPTTQYEDEMQFLRWVRYDEFLTMGGMTSSMQNIQKMLKSK